MRRKCNTCLCRTCLNVCGKCSGCKEKIESCENYNGFRQINIFETKQQQSKSSPRHSWKYYGIDKKRYNQLVEYVRSGRYAALASYSANMANKTISMYILLSVKENKSYDALKAKWELREMEQIPYCRTDFYGIRRYFFSILDKELRRIGK